MGAGTACPIDGLAPPSGRAAALGAACPRESPPRRTTELEPDAPRGESEDARPSPSNRLICAEAGMTLEVSTLLLGGDSSGTNLTRKDEVLREPVGVNDRL